MVDQAQLALRDVSFHTIVVDETGAGMMTGRPGAATPHEPIPDFLREDAQRLANALVQKYEAQKMGELLGITFDGVTYRVTRIPGIQGNRFSLRRPISPVPTLEQLGMHPGIARELLEAGKRHGLIIVGGEQGQGKTTTASALLREYVLRYGGMGLTVEDPPELDLEGEYPPSGMIVQQWAGAKKDEGFAELMASSYRANARYILLGECRTSEVAHLALRASLSGAVVIITVHGASVESSVMSLMKLAEAGSGEKTAPSSSVEFNRQLLANGLLAVLHQRLSMVNAELVLQHEFVFPGHSMGDPVRAKLRSGRYEMLAGDKDMQMARLAQSLPIHADDGGRGIRVVR